jgi:guanylate kinase
MITSCGQGLLLVVSAPSGAGKSTLCNGLRATEPWEYSVSHTTRAPREGEVNGREYLFVASGAFEHTVNQGGFLEYARVHGHAYGTPKQPVLDALAAGRDVLLDIDVRGAEQVRACTEPAIQRAFVDIFIVPPSLEELERRLRGRGTDEESTIVKRLHNAREELKRWSDYRYVVRSRSREEDLAAVLAILRAERSKSARFVPAPTVNGANS